ncbi:neuraminidase-like domain-containing protein, partial [Erwinia persicina]
MYQTDEILDRLNAGGKVKNTLKAGESQITLPDIMVRSFAEVKELAGDSLTWGEKNFLYQQAQAELKENKMAESRILSRANPQLANAVRLGIRQSSMLRSYDDLFPQRASSFVKPGSVASMFSPAGYLTELYREAKGLHADTSAYHLDTRRPDLASLSLSQTNMDVELSTLSLSNELLLNNIQMQEGKDYDGVMEMLAAYRQTGETPYSQPYEAVRQSIILQDPEFAAFRNNPAVAAKMDAASLLGIQADISPGLREILTEEITNDNEEELFKKNFGDNAEVSIFQNIAYLARWYNLPLEEMGGIFNVFDITLSLDADKEQYKDDFLTYRFISDEGSVIYGEITRVYQYKSNFFDFIELIPSMNDEYNINFRLQSSFSSSSFYLSSDRHFGDFVTFYSADGEEANQLATSGIVHSIKTKLTDKVLNGERYLELHFNRSGSDEIITADMQFVVKKYSDERFFLVMNKLIRLYKAIGIAPSDIHAVIESSNSNLEITSDVLSRLFLVNYYMQQYGTDVYAALVLSGANIGQMAHGNQVSAFTRLFNTPMLSNTEFSADGTTITLVPGETTDTFRTGVMKRAFGVSDTELYALWSLVSGNTSPPDFTCTIENLSSLYRASLLASLHGLSVTELAALLSVSPYTSVAVASLSGAELSALVSFIAQYTQWLKDVNWTVGDLYLMLTDSFSTTLSPDIENLAATLKNGLASQDLSKADEAVLITAAAPFIAAATQLDSAETAAAVLQWLNQLKPQGLTVSGFLTLVDNDARTDDDTVKMVSFCQVMGQLALIARNAGLSASELSWVVAHPTIITEKATALGHDISTLYDLTQLHALLARCGTYASEILTSLSGNAKAATGNLAVKTVATALNLDEQALTQALARCSSYAYFYSWIHLRDSLQWMNVAGTFNITPANVAVFTKLTYSSPYADWVAASHALQAGLDTQQTTQLAATLDEALGAAVSAYVIKTLAPSWVISRDTLYGWLLIDNQVSAQIKTTRIAEAIASVQLYVNRALSGQEEGVVSAVKSKTFFSSDWDTYNKRYSTWSGVSQLVYYPENYVDPTLRIGQTGMMDEMLQSLSQSQLTSDTVEATFKTYMTRFEEIANLDVISGYHDAVSDKSGKTYLIGRSAIGDYYWRSADVDKMSDGKLPANAWSEWKKITAGITPVANLVRPVIFQSRLYVAWVESREVATTGSTPTKSVEYLLKYAHILHDGTWSAPVTITPAQDALPPKGAAIADTGMYCARDAELDKLYVYFYKKADSYSTLPSGIAGLSLYPDGTTENIPADSAALMTGYIYLQLDTTSAVRLNTPYTGGSSRVSVSGTTSDGGGWGDLYYTYVTGGKLSDLTAKVSDNNVVINFNATARVVYNGHAGARSRTQVEMMKITGSMGDSFILSQQDSTGNYASKMNFTCENIVNLTTKKVYFKPSDNYLGMVMTGGPAGSYEFSVYYAIANSNPESAHITTRNSSGLWERSDSRVALSFRNIYVCRSQSFPNAGYDFAFLDFALIITSIPAENVKISVGSESVTSDTRAKFSFDESLFSFNNKTVSVPMSSFSGNTAKIAFTMSFDAPSGDARSSLGSETFTITLTRVDESSMPVISLNRTDTYARYLQYGVYRIRVNTLFAKQLIARANAGLNAVLSMESQQLQEPKLGKGFYADFSLPAYDSTIHGSSRNFTLNLRHVVDNNIHVVYSGVLADSEINMKLFVPLDEKPLHSDYIAKVSLLTAKTTADASNVGAHFKYSNDAQTAVELNTSISDISMFSAVNILGDETEPMDFSGANALYFWEMFYYVPMMVFKRLLSESRFTEATQWIKYVWSPDGYLVNNQPAAWTWNVRPLEEETTWHANPLDSVDPDAVAQADPMHYKVATFMAWLDLLIARGDAAYRQLERDTLNEA